MPTKCIDQMPTPMLVAPALSHWTDAVPFVRATRQANERAVNEARVATA